MFLVSVPKNFENAGGAFVMESLFSTATSYILQLSKTLSLALVLSEKYLSYSGSLQVAMLQKKLQTMFLELYFENFGKFLRNDL